MLTDWRQYRKWWVAVAGVLAQALVALAAAVELDVLPDRWLPWVAVLLALGTALGVRRAPNDDGRGTPTLLPSQEATGSTTIGDDWQSRESQRMDRGATAVAGMLIATLLCSGAASVILVVGQATSRVASLEVCLP